jgi:hypothetical protein
MISIEDQQKLLINVSRRLKRKITVYAVGGTAMMFLGIKDTTLDIDLVFNNNEDKEIFKDAAKELGYIEMDPTIVYGTRNNRPDMLTLKDERFDLFVNEVIDFIFSDKMKERTEKTLDFEDKLILKIANLNDIILMKCATDRIKDKDDVRKIVGMKDANWNLIINEAKNQFSLGKEKSFFYLGSFLSDLKEDLKVPVPQKVIDELWDLTEEKIEEKKKLNKSTK